MRIPLLHADFQHGSYTKVAKALRKIWPLGDQSLMQAQNALAVLLGYNGLHDAQSEATAAFSVPDGSLSMEKLSNAVAWRMFVRYGIDLLSARTLVLKLHLVELAVFDISLEAKMRRVADDAASKGLFLDEMWSYMNYREPWPEQTPRLLRTGVPPYQWAIYRDKSVFLWPKLVAQIAMLPDDFAQDLRQAGKLGDASDAVDAFIMGELMPAACEPLTDALSSGALIAATGGSQQWQVKWIATERAEILGTCIVAEKLGGIVAQVFDPDGSAAYTALAALLCGDAVPVAPIGEEETQITGPLWLIDGHRLQQLKQAPSLEPGDTLWEHERLPGTVSLYRGREGSRLVGVAGFRERGQSYLATTTFDPLQHSRMLEDEKIFETFDWDGEWSVEVAFEKGIPASGNHWHHGVSHMFSSRKTEVEAAMRSPSSVDTLTQAVLALSDPASLDAFAEPAITEMLPLRYEGDIEDNEDLVRERRDTLRLIEHVGRAVKASMPSLHAYSAASLGYMALVAKGEYPGSRYQGMVDAPTPTDWHAQSCLLAAMLIYKTVSEREVSSSALACAIAPVLGLSSYDRGWSKDKIGVWYQSAYAVERRLKEEGMDLRKVEEWRANESAVERVRAKGEFVRAGDPIPMEKPKTLAEEMSTVFSRSRSAGSRAIRAEQSLSSFKVALE
ncbi:hypothetical protein [Paraburkholderia sp. J8-2]|uniref:hypothetical protein n=1 Tax=Paraburkholderia sp. J8-2 TaxID=2805440 RepID=UPI002AB700FC|nr:hypothetical protein [Paraburkholderia sp. J8-2]